MTPAAVAAGKDFWFATRGSGAVALLLLTASLALGIVASLRWRSERWPRFATARLHRSLTLLALAFVAVHVLTTLLDGYAPIGLRDAVVPFVSRYRPIWLGLGAVAFDLLLALVATSLLRGRIGYRRWRAVHWLAYAAWPVALVHALGTGSDARLGWLQALGLGSLALVAAAVLARVALARGASPTLRLSGGAVALLGPFVLLAWFLGGPAQPGWARRAGTPVELLASSRARPAAAPLPAAPARLPAGPFSAAVRGRISESSTSDGLVDVVLAGRLQGGPGGAVRIDLRGEPLDDGVAMTASGVSYVPAASPSVYAGSVTTLAGQRLGAVVAARSGQRLRLRFRLRLDPAAGTFTGAVAGKTA